MMNIRSVWVLVFMLYFGSTSALQCICIILVSERLSPQVYSGHTRFGFVLNGPNKYCHEITSRLQPADASTIQKTTKACYGSDNHCSMYQMTCDSHHVIMVGGMVYGTKPMRNCTFGVSDCVKTGYICCAYNETDMFTKFSAYNRTNISKQCNGKVSCSGLAPRLSKTPFSHYVVMNYSCLPESSAQHTTTLSAASSSVACDNTTICKTTSQTILSSRIPVITKPSAQKTVSLPISSTVVHTSLSTLSYFSSISLSTTHEKSPESHTKKVSATVALSNTKLSNVTPSASSYTINSTTTSSFKTSLSMSNSATKITLPRPLKPKTTLSTTAVQKDGRLPEITTCKTTTESEIVETRDNDDLDKGVIIGLIVGILAALALIVGIIICLCLRIKRKKRIRQHYYRNTNIFYTFPDDDLKDTGSTLSDCKSVETIEQDNTVIIGTNGLYEPFDGVESSRDQNQNTFDTSKYIILPVGDDNSELGHSWDTNVDAGDNESENELSVDTNERVNLENNNSDDVMSDSNGTKRVHFDPSELYASVRKESKTKF